MPAGVCSASVCVHVIIPGIVSEGGRMATVIGGSSNGSAYSLVVAYALILLSIWQVDLGLLRSASSPRIAAPAPFNVLEDSTPQLLNSVPLIDQVARTNVETAEA